MTKRPGVRPITTSANLEAKKAEKMSLRTK